MRHKTTFVAAAVLLGGLIMGVPAGAQQLFMHGYATQAYGQTSDYAQVGLGTGGTGDLRAAAVQARLAFFSTGTQFVVQGAHQRVGGSPLATVIDDVELDWAFAEQRVGDFSARVGRVPIPKGLMNEMRDVGTLLPFYQASKAFYTDGIETVDGVTLRYTHSVGAFDVEAQGFQGKIPIVISLTDQDGVRAIDVDGDGTYGGQLTFALPMSGVKVLGGLLDSDVGVQTAQGPATLNWKFKWVGAEYTTDAYYARAEHSWSMVPTFQRSRSYYVQAGTRVKGGLWLNVQREHSFTRVLAPPAVGFEYNPIGDWALGFSYAFSPKLVLKGEHHWSSGYALDQLVNVAGPAVDNRYFLLSFSTAF
jgi:hypothetical protein